MLYSDSRLANICTVQLCLSSSRSAVKIFIDLPSLSLRIFLDSLTSQLLHVLRTLGRYKIFLTKSQTAGNKTNGVLNGCYLRILVLCRLYIEISAKILPMLESISTLPRSPKLLASLVYITFAIVILQSRILIYLFFTQSSLVIFFLYFYTTQRDYTRFQITT